MQDRIIDPAGNDSPMDSCEYSADHQPGIPREQCDRGEARQARLPNCAPGDVEPEEPEAQNQKSQAGQANADLK